MRRRRTNRRVRVSWRGRDDVRRGRVRLYIDGEPYARGHIDGHDVAWDALYGFVEAFDIDTRDGSLVSYGWTGDVERY